MKQLKNWLLYQSDHCDSNVTFRMMLTEDVRQRETILATQTHT